MSSDDAMEDEIDMDEMGDEEPIPAKRDVRIFHRKKDDEKKPPQKKDDEFEEDVFV